MGLDSSHALGLALGRPDKRIICLQGDGSLLMNLGCLVTIAAAAPKNLVHLVVQNGTYEANGGHPIPNTEGGFRRPWRARPAMRTCTIFRELANFEQQAAHVLKQEGPVFATLQVEPTKPLTYDYPKLYDPARRKALKAALQASRPARCTHASLQIGMIGSSVPSHACGEGRRVSCKEIRARSPFQPSPNPPPQAERERTDTAAPPPAAATDAASSPLRWRFRHRQPIADAELGQQDARLGRIVLDLLPQLAHEDAQIVRVVQVRRAPHFLEQELVGHDVAGVLGEQLQQPVFLRRQHHARAVDGDDARRQVDRERPDLDHRLARWRRAPGGAWRRARAPAARPCRTA